MIQPAYPASQAAAERIHGHFTAHVSACEAPDVATLAAMIDVAFWASLRREEGHIPKISLVYMRPDRMFHPLMFESSLPMTAAGLTRLAAAVERPGIHLGVWRDQGELRVWGTTRELPEYCFVLEVVQPGLLVIKHSRGEQSGKFVNVAVLQGDEIKVIDQKAATVPDCPALLTSLLGLETQFDAGPALNVMIQLAVSVRAHGRGGTLLVVPTATTSWRESILHPITYSIVPPFSALADLMQKDEGERPQRRWQDALSRAVDGIAGLTAVDGATVITGDYQLLAFGVKIIRRRGSSPVPNVIVTEPIEGTAAIVAEPVQLGGTRHLSAAQFVHDQRDSIALVASQDGQFTVFAWSPCEDMVHAHRIHTLLL